ncbi:tetratricopeptide repeat protein [Marinifilum flexuosum]|uniref:NB-ARC domain-containing protein n=1 Tax=Marinifilum flexuosum TaxID=1117708 RepID=A0A419X403_9BACT|nr:tetratricopeptide repeat protein [Marinifilum flexuosum]RKE02451.1 NB-ARC domain-containing protein [Marinifilum flexuosum]
MEVFGIVIGIIGGLFTIIVGSIEIHKFIKDKKNRISSKGTNQSTPIEKLIPNINDQIRFQGEITINSNLPRRELFVGRKQEINNIYKAFNSHFPIISITGIGGIGKTSIAKEVCYKFLNEKIFDGVIWITAMDSKLEFEEVIDIILKSSDLNFALKLPLKEKKKQVNNLLNSYKILLVLDSFEEFVNDKDLIKFLENIPSNSRIFLTTRFVENIDAFQVPLEGFEEDESLEFVIEHAKLIGLELKSDEEKILWKLFSLIGFAPLAMKWALGQIKQRGQSIETVSKWIKSAKGDIFESIFNYSWSILNENDKLVLMTSSILHSSINIDVYNRVTELEESTLEDAITTLVELSLLSASNSMQKKDKKYKLHPLTRFFTKSHLRKNKPLETKLIQRSISYYLDFINSHGGKKWKWGSFDALDREYDNIVQTINWLYDQKEWLSIKEIRNQLTLFLSIRGHWNKRKELAYKVIEACRETNDNITMAWCLVYDLAYIDLKYKKYDSARLKVKEGIEYFQLHEDTLGVATATRHLGRIAQMKGDYQKAKELYEKSYAIYKSQDPDYGAFLLWDLGDLYREQKQYSKAKEYFNRSLNESSGKEGKSEAVNSMAHGCMGEIAQMEKEYDLALFHYKEGLKIANRIGRSDEMALANKRLALFMYNIVKDDGQALKYAKDAHVVYFQLADYESVNELILLVQRIEKKSNICSSELK